MKRKIKNNKKYLLVIILIVFILFIAISKNIYATTNNVTLTNITKVYFCSEITKTYGNGDCILLENYDSKGNKIYGLIDTGRKIIKNYDDGSSSTVVKEFLKDHGVEKLEFLTITHSHGDHNGDAITVLDNFEVDKIYMKEFDKKWSLSGNQGTYEDIIEKAVAKNIKVIGVSYLSLKSEDISPSRSNDFINNTQNAKEELFESFYYNNDKDNNIKINFGSATIQIFNWEMFDEAGNQYITGKTTNTKREIVENENNNSIGLLLTQGNKKAFFSGDINNLDKNEEKGQIGDEDRLKDSIGDIDLLKLGHHGYQYSNTEYYMNALKPEYAVITNDIGKPYTNTINWLEKNNVKYIYTTEDEKEVVVALTENDVYMGLEEIKIYETTLKENSNKEEVIIDEKENNNKEEVIADEKENNDKEKIIIAEKDDKNKEEKQTDNTQIRYDNTIKANSTIPYTRKITKLFYYRSNVGDYNIILYKNKKI